ncbi:hypothetical protein RND71_019094 [Anisodus tanguticus]|uniref:Protein TAR1 n=1 Tax=Anisodus tanguticus TaxID=243964 RepID=A0AAE1V948_9SOLA|nr:hypothetical protein RND71_019094 [Anisodus tanguticus]
MGSPRSRRRSARMRKHAEGRARARHNRGDGVPRAYREPGFGRPPQSTPPVHAPESIGGPARRRSTSGRGASPAPIRFPPDNFKHSLTLFSKSFSSFPRGTCSLLFGLSPYLALDGIHRPIWAAFPNNPTRRRRLVVRRGPGTTGTTGLSPSRRPLPGDLGRSAGEDASPDYNSDDGAADSKAGLFPVRSPLLGGNPCKFLFLRLLICLNSAGNPARHTGSRSERRERKEGRGVERATGYGARARDETGHNHHMPRRPSTWTRIGGAAAARGAREAGARPRRASRVPRGVAARGARARRARDDVPSACGLMASGATCVQRLDGSRDYAIHTKYRISLRSSSMRERDIRCRESFSFQKRHTSAARARARGRAVDSVFLGAFRARGFVSRPPRARARAGDGGGPHGGARGAPRPRARAPPLFQTSSRVVLLRARFDNDPSAGSPTETLLRLLLPLNDKVQWTSRNVAGANRPRRVARSEHFTGSFNRAEARPTGRRPGAHRRRRGEARRSATILPSKVDRARNLNDASPARWPCDPSSYHESSRSRAGRVDLLSNKCIPSGSRGSLHVLALELLRLSE